MKASKIILHPCGYFDTKVLEILSEDIKVYFNCQSELAICSLDMSTFYNPSRRQYDANKLIYSLSHLATDNTVKVMGILRVDLYVPILTYIFGQAELGGNIGLASLYRLRNELYGLEIDNNLLTERFRKVVLHETGHLFGLIHCHTPGCLMRSSTYVEDLDQKELRFCHSCSKQLSNVE